MTPTDILDLKLSDIDIPDDRARDLDEAWALALAGIIAVQGLTNPITVRKVDGRYRLVTGLHRLEAFRLNQQASIPARLSTATNDDEARLEEVLENLGRNELNALDRCHHLYELQQVWKRLHPEATHGGDRKSEEIKVQSLHFDPEQPQIFGFAETVAEKVGLSRRAIFLAVSIWEKLMPASRVRLPGTRIARTQSELKLLSEQPAPIQKKVLDVVLAADHEAGTVQAALDFLHSGVVSSAVEKQFSAFNKRFAELEDDHFDRLLAANEERIIASLKRRGRI